MCEFSPLTASFSPRAPSLDSCQMCLCLSMSAICSTVPRNACWGTGDSCVPHLAVGRGLSRLMAPGGWSVTDRSAVGLSSAETAGRATMRGCVPQHSLKPLPKPPRWVYITNHERISIDHRTFSSLLGFCGGWRGDSQGEMGSGLVAPSARINQTLPKVFSACGKKRYEHRFFQRFNRTGPTWCACVCRRLYAHAVSSLQGRMVLAVRSLLEQGVYGRPLVWLTHTAPSGRFRDK